MAAAQLPGTQPPTRSGDRTKRVTRRTSNKVTAGAVAAAVFSIVAATDQHRIVVDDDRKDAPFSDATPGWQEAIAEGFKEILAAVEEEEEEHQQQIPSVVRTERMGCSARRRQRRNRWSDSGKNDGEGEDNDDSSTSGRTEDVREVIVLNDHYEWELLEDPLEIPATDGSSRDIEIDG